MTENELLNYSGAWDRAIENNQADEIGAYMSDDWVCVATDGGITSKEQFLNTIRNGDLSHSEMSTEESRVKIYGQTGIVTGKGHSKGLYKGHAFSFYEWSTSVFIFQKDKWVCVHTMLTPV